MKKIGGFFPLHLPSPEKKPSLLSLWNIPQYNHLLFSNGRSALHHLLKLRNSKTLWLPAYSCTSLAEAVSSTKTKLRFFPLDGALSPDIDFLKSNVKKGDAVLVIDYFGRNPANKFLKFAAGFSGVDWIEDRAQSLLPAKTPWGDFVIYSPRKLLGVPDGGILLSKKHKLPSFNQPFNENADFIKPSLLRFEDKEEKNNSVWYQANRSYEDKITVTPHSMSHISQHILASTSADTLIKKRQANYSTLMKKLKSIAVLGDAKDFVPFAFPILVKDRKKVASLLHKNDIFAAHHWPAMPANKKEFTAEHQLSEHMLSLPVDQRYDAKDMERIIKLLSKVL